MKPRPKEQAIVKPRSTGTINVKQPRFEHLHFNGSMRVLVSGKSGSGKSQLMLSAVTDFYRGCFDKGGIVIVARTAFLDPTFTALREHAEAHFGQNNKERPFVFTSPSDPKLLDLFEEHEDLVRKEKAQRKIDKSSKPLTSRLWIYDDVSDDPQLRIREGLLPKLFCTGRHSCQSVWCNVHQLTAVSPLLRKGASMLCCFKISNALEMQKLTEEYSWLIGREVFLDMYHMSAGRDAPPYSWLTIMCVEQDPTKMFYARFDQRLEIDDGGEPEEPPPQPSLAQSSAGPPGGSRGRAGLSPSA